MKVTAETITDEQIDSLRYIKTAPSSMYAPRGLVIPAGAETLYHIELSRQTVPGVRRDARCWLAAAWNARHGGKSC